MSTPAAIPAPELGRRPRARRGGPAVPAPRRPRLALAGLVTAVAVEWAGATAILPVLPLLLRHRGVTVGWIGVAMAAFLGASFLAQYPLGRMADRIGRYRLLELSLLGYAAATLGFLWGGPVILAIACRAVQGVAAGGADVAAQALVVDLVPARRHGRAYGMLSGAQMGGMVVGPITGSLLAGLAPPLVFVAGAGAAVAAAVVLRATVRLPTTARRPGPPPPWAPNWRLLRGVLAVAAGGGLMLGVYEADWTLLMHSRGASGWQIGLSFALYALPMALLSWPAGWLADTFDRRWLSGSALAAAAACAAVYPFLPSASLLIIFSAVEAILSAAGYPATLALLIRSTGVGAAGRGQGLYASAQTGAAAVGAALGGVLFALGVPIPFVASAAVALGAVVALPWLWRGAGATARPLTAAPDAVAASPPAPPRTEPVGHGRPCTCRPGGTGPPSGGARRQKAATPAR